jgi:hypothetical protein
MVGTIFSFPSGCDFKVFTLPNLNNVGCSFFKVRINLCKQEKKQMPAKKSKIDRIAVGKQMDLDEVSCAFIPRPLFIFNEIYLAIQAANVEKLSDEFLQ